MWGGEGRTTSAKGSHQFTARPGHHLAPATLPSGRNVFEELGAGFSLLVVGRDGAHASSVQAFREAAAGLGLPLRLVDCGDGGGGTEPARYGAPLVLVRPDQFVAWTGQAGGPAVTAEQAREVLARVAG